MEINLQEVDEIVAQHGRTQDAVVPILQALQQQYRYLPEEALRRVCTISEISLSTIYSVATFFPQFRFTPAGLHTIHVCDGTACHLKGASEVYDAFRKELHLTRDEDTDHDGLFTVEKVRCLGCCTLAPAVQIDSVTYGHVDPKSAADLLHDFLAHVNSKEKQSSLKLPSDGRSVPEIRIGLGSCCVAGGSDRIRRAIEDTVATYHLNARIKHVSCVGMCHQTPLMEIVFSGQTSRVYAKVRPEDVPAILLTHFTPTQPIPRVRATARKWIERLYTDDAHGIPQRHALDPDAEAVSTFFRGQHRIATELCGEIDPTDLDEYRRQGGFQALHRCLADSDGHSLPETDAPLTPLSPEQIIEEIAASGLRGRGGAGFPTSRKWLEVRNASNGSCKYIICNGDEGDPGAFMDRMILESYPFRVIEGMLIASVAVGAQKGIFYIRAEYPLAVSRMRAALQKSREAGLLGENVMGSTHAFDIEVREGAGAFVCGEETALIASIEGNRPTPRYRPPYPAHQGLNNCPTLVNNVETLALIPWILRHGAQSFTRFGTETSKGTKVFALAGKIRRGGLIEVPMGTTIRQIVEEIGGGVEDGRTLKAVQVGGPSGGCIPARLADLPVDYETLTGAGSMMGSGGFVVLDDTDCIVDMSRYFLSFTQLESCGRCTPCRVGTKEMLDILTRLCNGQGVRADLQRLHDLAALIKQQSLCGLGRTAPNPVLSGLAHFADEFEAHIEGRCPAHKCRALVKYTITEDCIGCTKCAQTCPAGAIPMTPYQVHAIDVTKCVRCGGCYKICPVNAVKVE